MTINIMVVIEIFLQLYNWHTNRLFVVRVPRQVLLVPLLVRVPLQVPFLGLDQVFARLRKTINHSRVNF